MVRLALSLLLLCSCDPKGNLKVYVSVPEKGGLYRAQDDELILYQDSLNYMCMSKMDFETLIELCVNK